MADRWTGELVIPFVFMFNLQVLRTKTGFPLIVSSGYRTPEHDAAIGGAGVHPLGGVDITIYGPRAFTLVKLAMSMPYFTGLGVKQRGPYPGRFIHLDGLDDGDHPRPRIWSYG